MAVRDNLFNIFAATQHIGGRSFIRNLRTRHALVTETHIHGVKYIIVIIIIIIIIIIKIMQDFQNNFVTYNI